MEAAAGPLHDRRSRSPATTPAPDLWLLVARAGGLLALAMAYRLAVAARRPRRGRDRRRSRCCWPTTSSATSRAATPRACSSRCACGRSSATSTAAAPTPSCSASPPRCCAPRCGRSSASTGSGSRRGASRRRRALVLGGFARHGVAVVRAGVLGLGRLAARRQPRAPAQPRLARLRRPPVPRGLPPLVVDPLGAGAAAARWSRSSAPSRARRCGRRLLRSLAAAAS